VHSISLNGQAKIASRAQKKSNRKPVLLWKKLWITSRNSGEKLYLRLLSTSGGF